MDDENLTPFLLMGLLASPAEAQFKCGWRAPILDWLEHRYGETPQSVGVTGTGNLFEIFANIEKDTWTAIVTTPQGRTCLIASGESWHNLPAQISNDPES